MTDPVHPLAAAITLVPVGVASLFAQAVPPELGALPWGQLGGSAALVASLVLALKYMAKREEIGRQEIKAAYAERIGDLLADKKALTERTQKLEDLLIRNGPLSHSGPGV